MLFGKSLTRYVISAQLADVDSGIMLMTQSGTVPVLLLKYADILSFLILHFIVYHFTMQKHPFSYIFNRNSLIQIF